MELYESQAYVKKCFRDELATCSAACPYKLDIRAFLKKVERGRFPAAYRDMSTAIVFPTIAAKLCPRPCEGQCQRCSVGDEPINMGAIERACVTYGGKEPAVNFPMPPKSQRIAVVGAGPAGLACAISMARKKYAVTVFDSNPGWGGFLRDREDFEYFDADFAKQFGNQVVDFRFDTAADEGMLKEYDAVYVATGENGCDFGLKDSWNSADLTTSRNGWFMGGGVCGMPLMESVAVGGKLSQLLEAYLQTGRATLVVEKNTEACPSHFVPHDGEVSKPRVAPADPDAGYTKDEAKAEAGRCMQCICDVCMKGCELMAHYRKAPNKLAADIAGDSHTAPPFSNCEATRQTYSCNQCGWCGSACPEKVNMGDLFRFSREDRWQRGKWIPGIHDYWLRELDFSGSTGFYASREKCDYLFFPGCQLTASMPEHVLDAWNFMKTNYSAGILLGCCGAPAVWAGDLDRKAANIAVVTTAWEEMGRPKVVTACATCAEQLRNQVAGMEIVSLYELLNVQNAPKAEIGLADAALFDPCSARLDEKMHESVMALAQRSGCQVEELSSGHCCGYGGHMRLANRELYKEITDHRAAESDKPYIVYCANCLEVFRSKGKPSIHILDAVFGSQGDKIPTLEEKRLNTLRVKGALMQELENKDFTPDTEIWDSLNIEISDAARANMEDKMITDRDIREVIYRAEESSDYFTDDTDLRTAMMVRKVMTYWVDYRVNGDVYTVENAYSHRMRIGKEDA